ncbi:uncharacterized protein LOC125524615 [Triticum urartu]|uniref:uncharacterized protein LOC125524615 n=1 Tax=Triticum urartu TaxID=4572 RepID=UPI002043C9DA|nr:uncharacterized protein LOC125524615 [Triticum urartu]
MDAPHRSLNLCSRHARRLPRSSLQPSVHGVSCWTSPDHFIDVAIPCLAIPCRGLPCFGLAVEPSPRMSPSDSGWVPAEAGLPEFQPVHLLQASSPAVPCFTSNLCIVAALTLPRLIQGRPAQRASSRARPQSACPASSHRTGLGPSR